MQIVLRAAAMYFFVWFLTRAIGKKELATLSVFEMILLVVTGDLFQQGVMQEDMSVTGSALAISTLGLLVVTFSYISFRFAPTRPTLEGVSVVILRDGKPLETAMKVERLTLDEVRAAARQEGIDDLSSVVLGVLEPNGKFSFLQNDSG